MRKFAPSFDGRRGLVPPQTSFNVTSGSVHCQTTVTPGSESGHSEGSKNSYMDQCTFGAGPPARRAGSGSTAAIPEFGALSQEIEPSESNAADMGVRKAVDRLLACRRHPPSRAQDGPPLTLSPASFPRAPPFLFPVSPSGPFFWKLLFFRFPVRAAGADSRITAAAIPPRPDRQTEPGRTLCSSTSKLSATKCDRCRARCST